MRFVILLAALLLIAPPAFAWSSKPCIGVGCGSGTGSGAELASDGEVDAEKAVAANDSRVGTLALQRLKQQDEQRARWPKVDLSNQQCAGSVCPNEDGVVLVDLTRLHGVPGGRPQGGASNEIFPIDSVNDAIRQDGSYQTTSPAIFDIQGSVSAWAGSMSVAVSEINPWTCRGTSSPFTAGGGAGTASVSDITRPDMVVLRRTSDDRYYPQVLRDNQNCTSTEGNASLRIYPGVPLALAGTFQMAFPDASHPGPYTHRLWFQTMMEATWEEYYEPPVVAGIDANLVPNGRMETDCASDAGWDITDAGGSATKAQSVWSKEGQPPNATSGAYRGTGCTINTIDDDGLVRSPAVAVEEGETIWLRATQITAQASGTFANDRAAGIRIIDQDGNDLCESYSATLGWCDLGKVSVWSIGMDVDKTPWVGEARVGSEVAFFPRDAANATRQHFDLIRGWWLAKVVVPADVTEIRVEWVVGESDGTGTSRLYLDELVGFREIKGGLKDARGMTPLIPSGDWRVTFGGDSRMTHTVGSSQNLARTELEHILAGGKVRPDARLYIDPLVTNPITGRAGQTMVGNLQNAFGCGNLAGGCGGLYSPEDAAKLSNAAMGTSNRPGSAIHARSIAHFELIGLNDVKDSDTTSDMTAEQFAKSVCRGFEAQGIGETHVVIGSTLGPTMTTASGLGSFNPRSRVVYGPNRNMSRANVGEDILILSNRLYNTYHPVGTRYTQMDYRSVMEEAGVKLKALVFGQSWRADWTTGGDDDACTDGVSTDCAEIQQRWSRELLSCLHRVP